MRACNHSRIKLGERLCLITDTAFLPDRRFEEIIISALKGGVDMVQYRHSQGSARLKLSQALTLRRVTREYGAVLIINRDIDMAVEAGADGVQLGRGGPSPVEARERMGNDRLIGVSVHGAEEIREAEECGADFLMLSPVFTPGSKRPDRPPLGEEKFRELCSATKLPVFALGGITLKNAARAMGCGARGVASISGILGAEDVQDAAMGLKNIVTGSG